MAQNQPGQQQDPPGRTGSMRPQPDHGEESYRGSGRLAGKAAIITGGDSGIGGDGGIGRAVAIAFARGQGKLPPCEAGQRQLAQADFRAARVITGP
jgi:hypothetical protein